MTGSHARAGVAAVLLLLPLTTAVASPPSTGRVSVRAPQIAGCRVFPADNYWNTPVKHLPVHPRSREWLSHMSPGSLLHPDFGRSFGAQPAPYGIPITVVGRGHPRVRVHFRYASESDNVRYPLGRDTRIEGGQLRTGDRHAVIVDKGRCRLYETFATHRSNGRWRAGSGAVWNLGSNACGRRAGPPPMLPGCRSCPGCCATARSWSPAG